MLFDTDVEICIERNNTRAEPRPANASITRMVERLKLDMEKFMKKPTVIVNAESDPAVVMDSLTLIAKVPEPLVVKVADPQSVIGVVEDGLRKHFSQLVKENSTLRPKAKEMNEYRVSLRQEFVKVISGEESELLEID